MSRFTKWLCVASLIGFSGMVAAQELEDQPNTLNEKFESLNATSETYEQYKVITITRLNDFWTEVLDSLQAGNSKIDRLTNLSADQKVQLDQLQSKIDGLEAELEQVQNVTTTISFIGIDFQKTTYHVIVWGIIVILIIVSILIWWTNKSGSSSAKQAREEYDAITAELESVKNKAREHQVKLKRELQTALNQLEDLKRGRM